MTHEHEWVFVQWNGGAEFGVSFWVCHCGSALRVIHDPKNLTVEDPDNLQEPYIAKRQGQRVGVWTGE